MKTDLDLLPRADLPVIWEDFKTRVDKVRRIAETLTVTSIDQKDDMAIARRVRLNLREIRVAVEHKRVELGEGHLKEIQKVNGAAKAIREFIEPLEARLLIQEEFGERAEAARIDELALRRNAELYEIRPRVTIIKDLGTMSQENYDILLASLRAEVAEIEAANRLRVEAERRLAEQAIEMRRQEEAFLEKLQAEKVAENVRLEAAEVERAAERAESNRLRDIAEANRIELVVKFAAEQAEKERIQGEKLAALEAEARAAALKVAKERAVEQARLDAEQAEKDRIRDEQLVVLEAELRAERAVKLAEETRLRQLALAPDLEKLREFKDRLRFVIGPELEDESAKTVCWEAVCLVHQAATLLDKFYKENLTPE